MLGSLSADSACRPCPAGFLKPTVAEGPIANFALYDQRAALSWLQDNISLFGGDRSNVTLMGHGTGAVCASLLAISPNTDGTEHIPSSADTYILQTRPYTSQHYPAAELVKRDDIGNVRCNSLQLARLQPLIRILADFY